MVWGFELGIIYYAGEIIHPSIRWLSSDHNQRQRKYNLGLYFVDWKKNIKVGLEINMDETEYLGLEDNIIESVKVGEEIIGESFKCFRVTLAYNDRRHKL